MFFDLSTTRVTQLSESTRNHLAIGENLVQRSLELLLGLSCSLFDCGASSEHSWLLRHCYLQLHLVFASSHPSHLPSDQSSLLATCRIRLVWAQCWRSAACLLAAACCSTSWSLRRTNRPRISADHSHSEGVLLLKPTAVGTHLNLHESFGADADPEERETVWVRSREL